jgi:2-polyprenyl-3-methyl-5-hydroxy-6-metoxy-1,4-benzoquinol methylase
MQNKNYFNWYKEQATSTSITKTEMVGRSPQQIDSELYIFPDVLSKVPLLSKPHIKIIDIGCGCSKPVNDLITHSNLHNQHLLLLDSQEMLKNIQIDDYSSNMELIPQCFPDDNFVAINEGSADVVLIISVLHYIFLDGNFINFMDSALKLLKPGGYLLVADIPNNTKKKRFLSTSNGMNFHMEWSQSSKKPDVNWNEFELMSLDDSIIFFLMQRYRSMGFETYLLPQNEQLPFYNTREDILIKRLQ